MHTFAYSNDNETVYFHYNGDLSGTVFIEVYGFSQVELNETNRRRFANGLQLLIPDVQAKVPGVALFAFAKQVFGDELVELIEKQFLA